MQGAQADDPLLVIMGGTDGGEALLVVERRGVSGGGKIAGNDQHDQDARQQ